jgi:DNA-binding transcriptional LysR family regulator
MPAIHVQEGVQAGRLAPILPDWLSRSSNVYLVTPGRRPPERVRLLAEYLREAFAALPHAV